MKRTQFYIGIVLIVALLGAIIFVQKRNSAATKIAATNAIPKTATVETKEVSSSNNGIGKNAPVDSAHSADEFYKTLQEKFGITSNTSPEEAKQKMRDWYYAQAARIAERDQHPIEFYGKTLDESNQPLAEVNIHFSLNGGLLEKDLQSDANGNFNISDLVGKLLVIDVSKNGYYTSKSNRISFDYTTYRPNPRLPELFYFRKKGTGADLISAVLNVQIPRDGTPVNVDFLDKNFGANGQMQMSQTKPPYESWKQATFWSFKMEIPDGGFIEENDEFPFEAPENGYESKIEFNFKVDQPDWKTAFSKNYYFVFGNPRRYGQLTIQTDIMWGGAQITYAINPSGLRYLEPK